MYLVKEKYDPPQSSLPSSQASILDKRRSQFCILNLARGLGSGDNTVGLISNHRPVMNKQISM